jgi:ketosteroid isomerase-like protein
MIDDVQAIKNLIYSYAELLDTGDLEAMGTLFTHAVVHMSGGDHSLRGADAVRELIEQTVQLYEGIPQTKHLITNVIVDIEPTGSTAVARSYYCALQAVPQGTLRPILAGRWHDRFEQTDGRWRFTDRTIYNDLVGDVSRHLKGAGGSS